MKTKAIIATLLLCSLTAIPSCFRLRTDESEKATLSFYYSDANLTRTYTIPEDPGPFVLEIRNAGGKSIFHSTWDDRPESLELNAGSYTVSLVSQEDFAPSYDCPVFGDIRSITLNPGEFRELELQAAQVNSGIRLLPSEAFIATYREASVYLRSTEGTLAFSFDEKRTAFFPPGQVSILLNTGNGTTTIYNTELSAGEILTLRLAVSEKMPAALPLTGLGLKAGIDSLRLWTESSFAYDGTPADNGGTSYPSGAVSIAEARGMAGEKAVWVYGYVVGGDLSSSSCSFEAPFSSRTNLVLAASASERERARCMSVQLSQGDIRNALNLIDNPNLLGKKIYLKGDIVEAYYKLPGIQNLSDYRK